MLKMGGPSTRTEHTVKFKIFYKQCTTCAGAEWTDFNDTGNQFLLLSWLSEIRICFKELEAVFNLALEE